jgi:hypothetical protein
MPGVGGWYVVISKAPKPLTLQSTRAPNGLSPALLFSVFCMNLGFILGFEPRSMSLYISEMSSTASSLAACTISARWRRGGAGWAAPPKAPAPTEEADAVFSVAVVAAAAAVAAAASSCRESLMKVS